MEELQLPKTGLILCDSILEKTGETARLLRIICGIIRLTEQLSQQTL